MNFADVYVELQRIYGKSADVYVELQRIYVKFADAYVELQSIYVNFAGVYVYQSEMCIEVRKRVLYCFTNRRVYVELADVYTCSVVQANVHGKLS